MGVRGEALQLCLWLWSKLSPFSLRRNLLRSTTSMPLLKTLWCQLQTTAWALLCVLEMRSGRRQIGELATYLTAKSFGAIYGMRLGLNGTRWKSN